MPAIAAASSNRQIYKEDMPDLETDCREIPAALPISGCTKERCQSFSKLSSSQALQMLPLQRMNVTIAEIKTEQNRLRREIIERECMLAALDVVHKHAASGRGPLPIDLGFLLPAVASNTFPCATKELAPVTTTPEPPALPPPAPPERYVHPELKELTRGDCSSDTQIVRWAIGQMTRDYTLHHLAALLEREGAPRATSKISVVLSRLKARGEIEQIQSGQGPIPALFRRPEIARPDDFQPLDLDLNLPRDTDEKIREIREVNLLLKNYRDQAAQKKALQASEPSPAAQPAGS
ncbi:MAG TPA: hypothetical protein VHW70_00185 [Edaphobacter sp.]|jgi:hypothetical protein|nr:hypothetical protein [Edaphobacter sp.]